MRRKKGRKEKWKKVLTKACGGGIIAKLSDERDKRAKPRREPRARTEVSSASESRGRQPGERTEVLEPDVP